MGGKLLETYADIRYEDGIEVGVLKTLAKYLDKGHSHEDVMETFDVTEDTIQAAEKYRQLQTV